jgi:hypothetical protein
MEKYRRGVDQIGQHVQFQIKRANTFSACPNLKKKIVQGALMCTYFMLFRVYLN